MCGAGIRFAIDGVKFESKVGVKKRDHRVRQDGE